MQDNLKKLKKDYLNEIITNAKTIKHDEKFPFIDWYAEKTNKLHQKQTEETTFQDCISQTNKNITKNKKRKEIATRHSAIASFAVGLAILLLGISIWFAVIPAFFALLNIYTSIRRGGKLNRDIEGRSYILKDMHSQALHMLTDIYSKHYKNFTEGQKKEFGETLKEMSEFNKEHYDGKMFYYKWSSQGFRQGAGYTISAVQFISTAIAIVGIGTGFLPFEASLGLIIAAFACEVIGMALYHLSHERRNMLMEQNGKQMQKITDYCLKTYQTHEKIHRKEGQEKAIENIEDLKKLQLINLSKAEKTLTELEKDFEMKLHHECNHSHGGSCSHHHHEPHHDHHEHDHSHGGSCSHHHHNYNEFISMEDILMHKDKSQLLPTHTHPPQKGFLKDIVKQYSKVTKSMSQALS